MSKRKEQLREDIQAALETYLKSGNRIKKLPEQKVKTNAVIIGKDGVSKGMSASFKETAYNFKKFFNAIDVELLKFD